MKIRQHLHSLNRKSRGKDGFNFSVNKAEMKFDIKEWTEESRFQRALMIHYLDGSGIHHFPLRRQRQVYIRDSPWYAGFLTCGHESGRGTL